MSEKISIWKTGDLAFLANVRTCTKSPSHKWISRHRKIKSSVGLEWRSYMRLICVAAVQKKESVDSNYEGPVMAPDEIRNLKRGSW